MVGVDQGISGIFERSKKFEVLFKAKHDPPTWPCSLRVLCYRVRTRLLMSAASPLPHACSVWPHSQHSDCLSGGHGSDGEGGNPICPPPP